MVLILFFSGYSMGKEYSNTKIQTSAKIAEPIMVVDSSSKINMDCEKEKESYSFKVKNYKENNAITQVDLQYYIEILSQAEESISFKLYKNEEEIKLENNKTANMKLGKENLQEDCYQLEILYDKEKNTTDKNILQEIQIKVHSEQFKI